MSRHETIHQNFLQRVREDDLPPVAPPKHPMPARQAIEIFRAQLLTRALDQTSLAMQSAGHGFYTIGAAGHEGMAAVANAVDLQDMAFLHYRDAAFQIARAMQADVPTIAWDMLLSFACSSEDPMSGGRHKVLGSHALNIPPQTSTIGSHLPKAVGAAYSVGALKRVQPEHRVLAEDSIVLCSFGDGSLNHSTVQGAINSAGWTSFQSVPLPLLLVCEDNGFGISVRTPEGWVEQSMKNRAGIRYFTADGLDLYQTMQVASDAADYVRGRRRPAFLHLKMVRIYGHAGSDMHQSYMSRAEIEAVEAADPLLRSVSLLKAAGALQPSEALAMYESTCERVSAAAAEVALRPHLGSASDVMQSIVPPPRENTPTNGPTDEARALAFGSDLEAQAEPQHMSRLLNWALTDLMLAHDEISVMGEDVGRKGGVYGVTQKLIDRFGAHRVVDTLLDEQSILGLAIGMAHNGFIPVPEIQFLAYLHNAEDQVRGEAATLPFFSNGQFANPMVVRVAGLGYQRGFGGHFHNDNSIGVLRDIPGIVLACPSRGDDAAMMLRECIRLAREEQRVVIFLEPIALYSTRDLHKDGDRLWSFAYPSPDRRIGFGEVGVHGDGEGLAIVTYGNGHRMAHQALPDFETAGHDCRIVDLRWLSPLPKQALLNAVDGCRAVLVIDECRATGNISEEIITLFVENNIGPTSRVTASDSFIPTGPAYAATLPSLEEVLAAGHALMGQKS